MRESDRSVNGSGNTSIIKRDVGRTPTYRILENECARICDKKEEKEMEENTRDEKEMGQVEKESSNESASQIFAAVLKTRTST